MNAFEWLNLAPAQRRAIPLSERPTFAEVEEAASFLEFQANLARMTPWQRRRVDLFMRWLIFEQWVKDSLKNWGI